MLEDQLIPLIAQVGFPIAAFAWLALRQESTIEKNTDAIHGLKEAILEMKK